MLLLAAWPVLPAWLSQTCLDAGDTALPPSHTAPSLHIPIESLRWLQNTSALIQYSLKGALAKRAVSLQIEVW